MAFTWKKEGLRKVRDGSNFICFSFISDLAQGLVLKVPKF